MRLDLTEQEWDDCYDEYLDMYRNSRGSYSDQVNLKILLRRLDIDDDEIDYIIRTTRTK